MSPLPAGLLVFSTSAAVLVLEILAGRLLAPYVGVTLETYSGVIGTVLAGISLGTWYGGRLADRVDPRRTLGPMLILGGTLALCTLPAIRFFGGLGLGRGPLAIVTLALVGFFPPAAVLSAVTPTVVKLQLASVEHTGKVVGKLSALGTAGAIFGTFVTGFLLVEALPSRPIVLGLAGVLIAGGVALWAWLARRERVAFPVQTVVIALLSAGFGGLLPEPCQWESAYFCAAVVPDPDRPSGRILVLDSVRHSYVDLENPRYLGFSYAQMLGAAIDAFRPAAKPIAALHIGGGGFHLPRYVEATRPGSSNRVLELDPTLLRIAQDALGVPPEPTFQVRFGDARLGISEEPSGHYDLVIGDAFGGQVVPWHLTTREFVAELARTLRPDGLYAVNLIDYPPLRFARAELNTLRAVFEHVGVIAAPERLEGRDGGNFIFLASNAPLPTTAIQSALRARLRPEVAVEGAPVERLADGAPVLTDDHAPVDQLITHARTAH